METIANIIGFFVFIGLVVKAVEMIAAMALLVQYGLFWPYLAFLAGLAVFSVVALGTLCVVKVAIGWMFNRAMDALAHLLG